MTRKLLTMQLLLVILGVGTHAVSQAQELGYPNIKACNNQYVGGKTIGSIANRMDENHSGKFQISFDVRCSNGTISVNNLEIHAANLTDTLLEGSVSTFEVDQVSSFGSAVAPTAFLIGPCKSFDDDINGCRFWMMVVDNGDSNDIVSFLVVDEEGTRLAYGTGIVTEGDARIEDYE